MTKACNFGSALIATALWFVCGAACAEGATAKWYPTPVQVWSSTGSMSGSPKLVQYSPVEKASKKWHVCVSVPHMKDGYYLALDYGLVEEAKELGISLQIVQAGGYDHLGTQISQIEDCASAGADAVAAVAISYDGLNNVANELHARGIPFLTFSNNTASKVVSAQTQISWTQMGDAVGAYIKKTAAAGGKTVKVVWLPGPAGASWAEDATSGFRQSLKGAGVSLVDVKYGDTGKEVQLKLIEDAVQANPDLDFIAGNAVAAEAAVDFLRERGLSGKIKVVSDYLTPGVFKGLQEGRVAMALSDATVLQSRIVLDQAVRVLEKKQFYRNVSPNIITLDPQSVKTVDQNIILAPNGFKPVFNLE